jgi:hypothetical protein
MDSGSALDFTSNTVKFYQNIVTITVEPKFPTSTRRAKYSIGR